MLSKWDLRQREIKQLTLPLMKPKPVQTSVAFCVFLTLQLLSLFVVLMDSFIVHVLTCNSRFENNVSFVPVN